MFTFNEFLGITELSLVYSLVAIGIFLSFRVLNFSDLTVDASFSLGAAVFVTAMQAQCGMTLSLILSFLSGALAGLATAFVSIRLKFGDLLGSILIMYALYSVNFRIAGSSNLVLNQDLISFSQYRVFFLIVVLACVLFFLFKFLSSEFGLTLRAVGINASLVAQFGFPLNKLRFVGLALSNALVALSGSLFSYVSGFYDINLGTGTLIGGLTSLIIGESFSKSLGLSLIFCIFGTLIYRLAIHFGFNSGNLGLVATDLNIMSTFAIIAVILIRRISKNKNTQVAYADC